MVGVTLTARRDVMSETGHKIALVTGASRGIGRAVATQLTADAGGWVTGQQDRRQRRPALVTA